MEGELIIVSIISLVGMIAFYILTNNNWYKRAEWKFKRDQQIKIDGIKLQKIKKDMGLNTKSSSQSILPGDNTLAQLLPLAKYLSPDQIQGLVDKFIDGDIDVNSLGDYGELLENPIVNGILQGLGKGEAPDQNQGQGTNDTFFQS